MYFLFLFYFSLNIYHHLNQHHNQHHCPHLSQLLLQHQVIYTYLISHKTKLIINQKLELNQWTISIYFQLSPAPEAPAAATFDEDEGYSYKTPF